MPVGVQLLNENKLDEMCAIMSKLQKYSPISDADKFKCWEVLFGGDQLTRAHAVSAIRIRSSHDDFSDELTGLIPVIEDWHARLTLMKVIFYFFYSSHDINVNITFVCIGDVVEAVFFQVFKRKGNIISVEKSSQ